jgi:hypothetical protein
LTGSIVLVVYTLSALAGNEPHRVADHLNDVQLDFVPGENRRAAWRETRERSLKPRLPGGLPRFRA